MKDLGGGKVVYEDAELVKISEMPQVSADRPIAKPQFPRPPGPPPAQKPEVKVTPEAKQPEATPAPETKPTP
jgi:hypothetical protein